MPNEELSEKAALEFYHRLKYEDQLLNSRTSIVLMLNGLGAVAAGLGLPIGGCLSIATVIMLIDILWIICARDALYFIGKLTKKLAESKFIPADETFRLKVQEALSLT